MKRSILVNSVLTSFLIFSIGSASFLVAGTSFNSNVFEESTVSPVCYISGSNPQYFTTIEKALEVAGSNEASDTIYVIPNNILNNVTITRDCTIDNLDTLILPYEGTTWDFREGPTELKNRFADDSPAMVSQNRKTLVTIKQGVTLNVEGTLSIGGILGNALSGYQGLQGQTSGSYSEILMEVGSESTSGAKINILSGGIIDCRGYIKETEILDNIIYQPRLDLNSGGSLKLPFVIYDYQGASATGGIYCGEASVDIEDIGSTVRFDGEACLFTLFDMPNIQIKSRIYANSTVTGLVSLHTDAKPIIGDIGFEESWNTDEFTVVGATNSLLTINSGYVDVRYKPANLGYIEVIRYEENPTLTTVDFYGDCNFGSMQMILNAQIAQVEVNTSNVLFPFSYRWNFNIKNGGTINISNGIKFMNGSSLTVDNGCTLNLNNGARVILYNQSWNESKTTIPYMPIYTLNSESGAIATLNNLTTSSTLYVQSRKPVITGNAILLNNGTINVRSGSSIGGIISTSSSNSVLYVEDGASTSVQSLETNGTGGQNGLSYNFSPVDSKTLIEQAKTYYLIDFDNIEVVDITSGNFESTKIDEKFGFGTLNGYATIIGDSNILPDATKTYSITDNSSHLFGDEFIWSVDDPSKLILNSSNGKSIYVTGGSSGSAILTCNIYYNGELVSTVTKNITVEQEPYVNVNVSVDTSSIYDNPNEPFNIGGIGDYRDITVTLDTNCTNYSLNWKYDSSILELSSSSGSYPTFTYRFTTIGAGSDTISLDFVSDEITNNNIWTHDLKVSDNDRITYLTVNTSTYEINAGAFSTTNKDFTSSVSLDGDAGTQILIETVDSSSYAKINSASISGSTLKLSCSGISIAWQSYRTTFYLVSSNGVNGATVKSNLLTLNVTYSFN